MGILNRLKSKLSLNRKGDNHSAANFGCSLGVVVDTDDPLQMGRLRVYCPDLNDDPKKVQHLPWATYVSPFGGTIRNGDYTRGHQKGSESTSGTVPYGFWAIPEIGANVLVTCINGDPRRRVWMGCVYDHQEIGGVLTGSYDWNSGGPDGPLTSSGPGYEGERNPIQPTYDNLAKAFQDDKTSSEWKTRGGDYSGTKNVEIDSFGTYGEISGAEEDSWVKEKLGSMGYDWSGFKSLGAYLASRIVGFCSPGLHSIVFDDRAFNSRIKLRTTAGHQIILDDTNERIYVNTYEGKSWIELDVNGNIDVYSDRRISMRAKKDINFSTDETFRVKAKKGIHMYAGDTEGQAPLDSIPDDGQIRFQSSNDMHLFTEGDFYQKINGNRDILIDGESETFISGSINIESGTNELNLITPSDTISMESSIQLDSSGNIRAEASGILQLGGSTSNIEIAPGVITLDAPLVQFNDYGTSITEMAITINSLIACSSGCGVPLLAIPRIVIPEIMRSPDTDVEEAELAPWTNRVPDHEPWPRVLKQDSDDTVNEENDGYKNNVDWIDQYDNEGQQGREDIGVVEGDEKTERGEFWRR
jgi:hypothetical protein